MLSSPYISWEETGLRGRDLPKDTQMLPGGAGIEGPSGENAKSGDLCVVPISRDEGI